MLHPVLFLFYSLFFNMDVDAVENEQERTSTLLHNVDMLSKSISHPLRGRYEQLGPVAEHAQMQHILKKFLPTMHSLERVKSPDRLSIKPYTISNMPCKGNTIRSMRRMGRKVVLVKFYLHFYLRLPPWQANGYVGDVYRVILKDHIDFRHLEAKLRKWRLNMPLPPVPLLYAPVQSLSSSSGVLHLPIEKSYHPSAWDRDKHGYSNVFAFLALSLQHDRTFNDPKKKLSLFFSTACILLPGVELNVLSLDQTKLPEGNQIAVNLMQRIDTGDDIFLSALQDSYLPHLGKPSIVLARTIGTRVKDTLIMLVLELPNSFQPVSQFSLKSKHTLASLHKRISVHANKDEIDARLIREGNELFTQRYFQEFEKRK